ncbi:MAG TPA: hydroxymethylbilane synthase [Acidimicrobiales bacterium]|nr:hydroxymethylbilane synthase [Acidimicrobiales bacterium]
MRVRIATRGSPLARWQAEHVGALLRGDDPDVDVELVVVETRGDVTKDRPIHELGGQGVFVKEVQSTVVDGHADLAVHSAKDLPSTPTPGLVIAAVPERGDPRDALVGSALADLRVGATLATGSVRRQAQLAHLRPDLTFVDLRGNIQTRLSKVPAGGAVVMAAVALERLGLASHVAEVLDPAVMLPQVAQGALAVECREADRATIERLGRIEHAPSRAAVDGERSFLAALGAGCDLPVGAHVTGSAGAWRCEGLIADLSGTTVLRHTEVGGDPVALGTQVAQVLLDDLGGSRLLSRS